MSSQSTFDKNKLVAERKRVDDAYKAEKENFFKTNPRSHYWNR